MKKKAYAPLYNEFWNNMPKIGIHGIAVFTALLKFANGETGECFPSYERIMEMTGITNRNYISKSLKKLEEVGLIKKEKRFSKSTVYTVYPDLDRKIKSPEEKKSSVEIPIPEENFKLKETPKSNEKLVISNPFRD